MIRLIIFIVIGYFALKAIKSVFSPGAQTRMESEGKQASEIDNLMVKDPNCDTYIPKRGALRVTHKGVEIHFCSEKCRDAYLKNA